MIDISNLKDKIEDKGRSEKGKLTAAEWNNLVESVIEQQEIGTEVQERINEINSNVDNKIGFLYRTQERLSDNLYHIYGFANREMFEEWETTENSNLILANISIPSQESTVTSYVVKLVNGGGNTIISTDNNVVLKLRFTSVIYNPIDQSQTDTNETGRLSIYTRVNETYEWVKKDEVNISSLSKDSTSFTEIDVTKLCSNGGQQMRLIVRGMDSELATTAIILNVTKTEFKVEFAGQWQNVINTPYLPLSYYIQGSVDNKKLNILIDGKYSYTNHIGAKDYIQTPYSFTIQDAEDEVNPICTQGKHIIEAWLSVTTETETIESEHIQNELLIILDEERSTPYIFLQNIKTELTNWTNQRLFDYAVYNPQDDVLNITFKLYDYNRTKLYGEFNMGNVQEGVQYTFENMIEIEENMDKFSVRFDIINQNDDTLLQGLVFGIDNTENFSPTPGADFIINPKLRTNDEVNPARIINVVNNKVIPATFTNFGFLNDGWVKDESGIKCLRILADSYLDIDYEAFSDFMGDEKTNSLTIEFDIATRNVVDEITPIIKMCTYSIDDPTKHYGMEFRPMEGCFMTEDKQVRLDQDIMWQEGVRTHIAVNIVYNLANSGINYIRIFVNGCINREIDYNIKDTFVQQIEGVRTSQGIRIGAPQSEIDIYGIRIYKSALSSSDIQQDYVSSLSTSQEKKMFKESNDILVNGLINYEKTKVKYNTMLWKPNAKTNNGVCRLATYGDKKKQLQYGDLDVIIVGDKKHSGKFYNMNTQGQGTSSMSYWKWNQRIQFDEADDNGNGGGYFINEDGERYEGKYQLEDGIPFATRLDGKLNWASSMQSHKVGATALYHDVWKQIIEKNDITSTKGGENFTGTENGYGDCRVTVLQKPFFMFVQETETSEPVFYGLYTWGPGKGDKPTFGYDKKSFPDYTMIEGCDNNMPMVMCRVPWDSYTTYGEKGAFLEDEIVTYNGLDNWELSMGSGKLWEDFKEAFNFVYLLHDDIHPYVGTYSQLIADKTVNKDQDYWVTSSDDFAQKFTLFRYDAVDEEWVHAGLDRAILNLNAQCGNIILNNEIDWDVINTKFINKRVEMFKNGIGERFDINDLLYTMSFLLIVCATDNRGKNTYLYKVNKDSKIMFLQDDLDTVFLNNNVGKKTKPYYIEVFDKNDGGEYYWTSTRNALYNLAERAFPTELRSMTKNVLSVMSNICGGTLNECFEKYFTDVQKYFPAVAFNETARLLYEEAAIAVSDGRYNPNTLPLPQSLGNLLEAEKEWIKNRLDFISSYASYGQYDSGDQAGALAFRSIVTTNGQSPVYEFELIPHKWMYPSVGVGDSAIWSGRRIKAGETLRFPSVKSDGNTNIRILDINKYRHVGTWGDKSVGEGFLLSGERLTEFIADSKKPEFRPTSLEVSARNLEKLGLNGISTLIGSLDLSKNVRLKEFDVRGTKFTNIYIPETNSLTTIGICKTIKKLELKNLPNLNKINFEEGTSINNIIIKECPKLDSYNIIKSRFKNEVGSELKVTGIDWTITDTSILDIFATLPLDKVEVKGKIKVEGALINFNLKRALYERFGDIDDPNNSLYIYNYVQYNLSSVNIGGSYYYYETGKYTLPIVPDIAYANNFNKIEWSLEDTDKATINPNTGVLDILEIGDEINSADYTSNVQVKITKLDGTIVTFNRAIYFFQRNARLGDFVYADGSWSDIYEAGKTVVGICYYVDPEDLTKRMCVKVPQAGYGTSCGAYCWGLSSTGVPDISLQSGVNAYQIFSDRGTLSTNSGVYNSFEDFYTDGYEFKTQKGNLNEIGFKELTENDIELLNNYLEEKEKVVGYKISYSRYNTLRIIRHRNLILSDPNITDNSGNMLPIPISQPTLSEYHHLLELIQNVISQTSPNNENIYYYSGFYYYPASYAYAYDTSIDNKIELKTNEVLSDKFARHKWALPSFGDVIRIAWYAKLGYEETNEARECFKPIFAKAKKYGVISSIPHQRVMCSTEDSTDNTSYIIDNGNGKIQITGYNKSQLSSNRANPLILVCEF